MLKFDGEKWQLYKKKISYLAPYSFYTDEAEIDESWIDVKIEDLQLSMEQQKRLEQVENFVDVGIDDLQNYVLHGKIPKESQSFSEFIKVKKSQNKKTLDTLLHLIDIKEATPVQLETIIPLIESWDADAYYLKNDYINYEGDIYKILQDHIASELYPPGPGTESLYAKLLTSLDGTILDWEQPESTNGYMKGDRVKYNGKVYESLIDNNVWSPEAYPTGWVEVP